MESRPAVDDDALAHEALSVLDANWTGSATVPAPGLYPHQWSWDSIFVAIGLARWKTGRAMAELRGALSGQWRDGMVPHVVFHSGDPYFPGPKMWRSEDHKDAPHGLPTSGLTAPPLHAYAVWWIWRHHGEAVAGFVREVFPRLAAQHAYLAAFRDLGGAGLASIVHPWESGMDDSPTWDLPLAALPRSIYGFRHDDAPGDYTDHFVWLAKRYRDSGYRPEYLSQEHPFAVEDPMFNGVWLAACEALAELAPVAGADPRPHTERAAHIRAALLERLWDGGGFHARDLRTGRLLRLSTVGSFGPLLDPGMPGERVESMVRMLSSARFMGAAGYPVPSCDIRAEQFDRGRYWRGPSWVNMNWLLCRAAAVHGLEELAAALASDTLRLVRQAGFRECFDPFDGSGRGCRDFSWSAALALDLLADEGATGGGAGRCA
ncbi:MGH1-like glycoside hydrolase domain-containing protein [Sinosporangium siamense]|uniref:Mannosylglycerate hydrolase MGH1-like glycoside hydrolase domain-containing protein n=1 Tax=Sinosporangium siamense TaxID=1367973 RepID=A0A919V9D0_9ACTN|nr:hypothetical protein [Sinosporangium siamense]GII90019.1 hypothetical protein Ssi02_02500 [Sinosporangium siamense]